MIIYLSNHFFNMSYKLFLLILSLFSSLVLADTKSFNEFSTQNYFAPIVEDALKLKVVCRKSYDDNNKKKYYELLFYNNGKNVFDLNKHFRSFKEGHKNLKTPFYSFTFWNWFQSIAIESGGQNFMTSTEQFSVRRSELVPSDLVTEIINDGLFSIYFHYLKDNTKSYGLFKVTNPEVLKDCFA